MLPDKLLCVTYTDKRKIMQIPHIFPLFFVCIPDDQTRVCLTPTPSEYESDYINANFIKVLERFNFKTSYQEHHALFWDRQDNM